MNIIIISHRKLHMTTGSIVAIIANFGIEKSLSTAKKELS